MALNNRMGIQIVYYTYIEEQYTAMKNNKLVTTTHNRSHKLLIKRTHAQWTTQFILASRIGETNGDRYQNIG